MDRPTDGHTELLYQYRASVCDIGCSFVGAVFETQCIVLHLDISIARKRSWYLTISKACLSITWSVGNSELRMWQITRKSSSPRALLPFDAFLYNFYTDSSHTQWDCAICSTRLLTFVDLAGNCSFPYTYRGGLYYNCTDNMLNISTADHPLVCVGVNATPAICDLPGWSQIYHL